MAERLEVEKEPHLRIFPRPVEIGDLDGFKAGADIFGREAIGIGLTSILSNVADPLVIAVDGAWGCGKTTFLRMWAGSLRLSGFPVIFFDAFENDFSRTRFWPWQER